MRRPELGTEQFRRAIGHDLRAGGQSARQKRPSAALRCHLDALSDEGVGRGPLIDPLATVDIAEDRSRRHRQSLGLPGERQVHRDPLADAEGAVAIVDGEIQIDRARDGVGRWRRLHRTGAAWRAGVAERDVQTSGLNLSAQYDYQQNEPPKLRGYQAVNRVTVTINDLTKVGTTADAVVAAGVNQIDGISFGLKDPSAAEDQARRLAVQALQAKAQLYAQALNVQLAGIRNLSEGGGYAPQPPQPMFAARAVALESRDSTPVAAGELTVRIDITGVYDIAR